MHNPYAIHEHDEIVSGCPLCYEDLEMLGDAVLQQYQRRDRKRETRMVMDNAQVRNARMRGGARLPKR